MELTPAEELKKAGPTPQLVANHPTFVRAGVWLMIFGFVFQLPLAWVAVKAPARSTVVT